MKKYFLSLMIITGLFSCTNKLEDKKETNTIVVADATAVLSVEGMVCQHGCANYLAQEISSLDGVKDCSVSFEDSSAIISYDNSLVSETSFIDLINSTKDSIYSVTNVEVALIKNIEKEKIQTH
jgi:Cu+-exporting ATPase